jgi:hypothetical protein
MEFISSIQVLLINFSDFQPATFLKGIGKSDGLPAASGKVSGNPTACFQSPAACREIRHYDFDCRQSVGLPDTLFLITGSLSGNPKASQTLKLAVGSSDRIVF